MNRTVEERRAIAEKWYQRLGIDARYLDEFRAALATAEPDPGLDPVEFAISNPQGVGALIQLLYACEALFERFRLAGISEDIFLATMDDIRIYCEEWSAVKGELTMGTVNWLRHHFNMELFRLGRLQFCMAPTRAAYPERDIPLGAPILEVHIPRGEKMTPEVCIASFREARVFFAKYFPEYSYSHFTCNSWLLDASLSDFLPPDSNIIRFGAMFDRIRIAEGYYMLSYLYPIGTTVETLPSVTPTTSLAAKVKDAILSGRVFYPSFGVIPADAFDD